MGGRNWGEEGIKRKRGSKGTRNGAGRKERKKRGTGKGRRKGANVPFLVILTLSFVRVFLVLPVHLISVSGNGINSPSLTNRITTYHLHFPSDSWRKYQYLFGDSQWLNVSVAALLICQISHSSGWVEHTNFGFLALKSTNRSLESRKIN